MFESIGMQRNASSETEGLDTLGEEYDLRRLGPLNNFFLLPASGIITFVLLFVTDLPRLLILPTLCLTYAFSACPRSSSMTGCSIPRSIEASRTISCSLSECSKTRSGSSSSP